MSLLFCNWTDFNRRKFSMNSIRIAIKSMVPWIAHGHKISFKNDGFGQSHIQNSKMKILPFLFGYIFQGNEGHSIVKRAGPISQTNICINECTGVADDWTNYDNLGIKVDGNLFFLSILFELYQCIE